MSVIGTFKRTGNEFTGEVVTLSVQQANVRIVRETQRANDDAPTHRVFVGRAEIGAGWTKPKRDGSGDYLSLKLDDPSFNQPIFANLWEDEQGGDYKLIWSRGRDSN
jgi:uncharacterized protein (DUF736 family)